MTGLLRRATFLAIGAVLVAGAAVASVPNSTNSIQPGNPGGGPQVIKIVGHGSPPDPAGNVTYTIKDGQAIPQPVQGSVVILNFAGCGEVRLCSTDQAVGNTTNCASKTVSGVTNASGVVVFAVAGSGSGAGALSSTRCVTVTADGVPMNSLGAATADYNGTGGVSPTDGGQFAADLFAFPGVYRARSDFNSDLAVTPTDGGVWAGILFGLGSLNSCGEPAGHVFCP